MNTNRTSKRESLMFQPMLARIIVMKNPTKYAGIVCVMNISPTQ